MERSVKDILLQHYCWTITNTPYGSGEIYELSKRQHEEWSGSAPAMEKWLRLLCRVPWSWVQRVGNVAAPILGGSIVETRRTNRNAAIIIELFVPDRVLFEARGVIRHNVFWIEGTFIRALTKDSHRRLSP